MSSALAARGPDILKNFNFRGQVTAGSFAWQIMTTIDLCVKRAETDNQRRPLFPRAQRVGRRRLRLAGVVALTLLRGWADHDVATARPTRMPAHRAALREPTRGEPSALSAAPTSDSPGAVPLHILAGHIEPVESSDPELPAQVLSASRGKVLEGAYRICILSDGSVQSVTAVVPIAGADDSIIATLKTWRYPKLPLRICKVQTLSFEIP